MKGYAVVVETGSCFPTQLFQYRKYINKYAEKNNRFLFLIGGKRVSTLVQEFS